MQEISEQLSVCFSTSAAVLALCKVCVCMVLSHGHRTELHVVKHLKNKTATLHDN